MLLNPGYLRRSRRMDHNHLSRFSSTHGQDRALRVGNYLMRDRLHQMGRCA